MRGRRAVEVIVLGLTAALLLGANGSKSKRVLYGADVQSGAVAGKRIRFDAELEPLLFRLATLRDKYRVVRIRIRNGGDTRLVLSLAGDRIEMQLATGPRAAILDLGAHDPEVWDGLSPELRGAIAYPRGVDPGEEESVFVFVPVGDAATLPRAFRYTIASVPGGPVNIREITPAMSQ
jgi:hypothetical protein